MFETARSTFEKDDVTKAIICIASWVGGALRGENQALRETWLKDCGVDYKFFIGDGTPTGEDETAMLASFSDSRPEYLDKAISTVQPIPTYHLLPDEVLLHVPDDYLHLAYKVRGEFRWAIEHGYEHIFSIGADIYVDVQRLMRSGFEQYDYTGKLANTTPDCAGGGGYWISRSAAERVIHHPVTFWAEDKWVGQTLHTEGCSLHIDSRYATDYPDLMHKSNDIITCHIGCHDGPFGVYNPEVMRDVHRNYRREFDGC